MPQMQKKPNEAYIQVKTKYQLTLPTTLRRSLGVDVGDLFKAAVRGGELVLTPASVLDRDLAEGLRDLAEGRTHGPFNTADEAITFLHSRKRKKSKMTVTTSSYAP